jgi:GNAT superfamily N-acetyltransferase
MDLPRARRGPYDVVVKIRDARVDDAPAACKVLRRSIVELCIADHGNDPVILAHWLANKTPESIASWIIQPGNSLLVASEGDSILGVGSVTDGGRITLNYVSPDARFRGVSRALLAALKTRAVERGVTQCTLSSTETAKSLYLSAGYVENGPPERIFGAQSGYPMTKDLSSAA